MSEHFAEKDAGVQTLRDAAKWLRGVSEKCCECTDGHHVQQYAYGTESDVRASRDTARALADLLESVVGHVEREQVMEMGDLHRRALAVARGVLTGSVLPPGASS
jgi:hypothetical protein